MTTIGHHDPDVETYDEYIDRVVANARPLTPELARRIAKLLPMPSDVTTPQRDRKTA